MDAHVQSEASRETDRDGLRSRRIPGQVMLVVMVSVACRGALSGRRGGSTGGMTGRQEQQLRYQSEASPTDTRGTRILHGSTDHRINVDTDNKKLFHFYTVDPSIAVRFSYSNKRRRNPVGSSATN